MTDDLPNDIREFLALPNPAVMATTTRDGQPIAVATWYDLEADGRVLVNLDAGRTRLAHLRRDPRWSLDVLDSDDWYQHVALQLRVVEVTDDADLADIDRLSVRYTGKRYSNRERPRVSVRAHITKLMPWR